MSDDLATQEQNEPTMDETIAAKWAEIESRGEIEQEEIPASPRDDKGRFAAKQEDEPQEEIKPARKAPSSWKKEAQERYATLDPLFQDEIDRREADFHKGLENYRAKAQQADEWEKALQPYSQTLQGFGVPAHQAVSNLLAVDQALRYGSEAQKQQIFQRLAADYGVKFSQQQAEEIDPKIQPFVQRMQTLEQGLAAQKALFDQQRAQAQQQELQQLNSKVAAFAQGKEHFETVRADMAALLQAERATDLDDAYQKAIWANPETRQALIAKQQEEAKAEAQRVAKEAKKMAQINVKRKGTLDPAKPIGTMDETIRETAQRLGLV